MATFDYTQLIDTLALLATQASTANGFVLPADFVFILPNAVAYGELRCYKTCTFLATRAQDSSLTFSGNTRTLNLANMTTQIIVPEGVAAITPVGAIPSLGTRLQFEASELAVIDMLFPTESRTVDPATTDGRFWALQTDSILVVGPTPDAAYVAEITGLFQPAQISATNPTTYLYTNYPTFLQAACMVYVAGYMRNYGAKSDNPQIATSWENEFKTQTELVKAEEDRRRQAGVAWSPYLPAPLATPARSA